MRVNEYVKCTGTHDIVPGDSYQHHIRLIRDSLITLPSIRINWVRGHWALWDFTPKENENYKV